jgi:hypothetical protein
LFNTFQAFPSIYIRFTVFAYIKKKKKKIEKEKENL